MNTASGLPDDGLDLKLGIYRDASPDADPNARYLLLAVSRQVHVMNWLATYAALSGARGNKVWSMPVAEFRAEFEFLSTNPNLDY